MLNPGCWILAWYNPVCFLGHNAGCWMLLGHNAECWMLAWVLFWMLAWYNGRKGFHFSASINSVYASSSFPFLTSSREARPGPGVHKPEGLAI